MSELREAYVRFFIKSEHGKQFISTIEGIIQSNHEKSENDPELARDYTQRAKGLREAISHIQSVVAERKKPIKQ